MKIAYFTDSYYPMLNGVTLSVDNFAQELRKLGHTVYIFAPKMDGFIDTQKDVYRVSSVKILSTEPPAFMPFMMPHKVLKEINPRDFDIVHAHGNGPFSLLGHQIARLKGIPYILTIHTQHTRYTHYLFNGKVIKPKVAATGLKLFSNISDEVITPSNKMKDELETYGVSKPITVVPNFIYQDNFRSPKTGFLHTLCKIPTDSPILLCVGRLGKEKDIPFILRSFRLIAAKDKKSHLVFVGSGEELNYLKMLTEKYQLTHRVHFTGRIQPDKIPEVYADGDIFLYASRTETQGLVIVEAAAAGLPFVVVKDGAFEKSIEDSVNGYMTPANTKIFSQKVLSLLSDAALRSTFAKKSRNLVARTLQPDTLTKEMLMIYDRALNNKKQRKISLSSLNEQTLKRLYTTTKLFNRIFE